MTPAMFQNLSKSKIVDLTVELVSRLTRLDGTTEAGTRDVYNMPWIVEETVNERDGTIEHLVGTNKGTVRANVPRTRMNTVYQGRTLFVTTCTDCP